MAHLILTAQGKPAREALLTIKLKCPQCGRTARATIWERRYKLLMSGDDLNYTPEDAALIRTGICHTCYSFQG